MGHWAADKREPNSQASGTVLALNAVWQVRSNQQLEMTLRSFSLDSTPEEEYQDGYEANVRFSHATSEGMIGIEAKLAKDAFGQNAHRIALFYRW